MNIDNLIKKLTNKDRLEVQSNGDYRVYRKLDSGIESVIDRGNLNVKAKDYNKMVPTTNREPESDIPRLSRYAEEELRVVNNSIKGKNTSFKVKERDYNNHFMGTKVLASQLVTDLSLWLSEDDKKSLISEKRNGKNYFVREDEDLNRKVYYTKADNSEYVVRFVTDLYGTIQYFARYK